MVRVQVRSMLICSYLLHCSHWMDRRWDNQLGYPSHILNALRPRPNYKEDATCI